MENQQTNMVLPEVIFFANQVAKGNNLGGGFIKTGGIQIRFGVFLNDKFSQGFSISFPIRKNTRDNSIIREVEFLNKETEQHVYNQISPKVAHLLGRMPTQQAQAQPQGGYQQPPQAQFQQGFAPQNTPVQQAAKPIEEPRVIGEQQPAAEGASQGDKIPW